MKSNQVIKKDTYKLPTFAKEEMFLFFFDS